MRLPAATPQAPSVATATVTGRSADGAGVAVTVKTALPPSVTAAPPVTLTAGTVTGGVSGSDAASSFASTSAICGHSGLEYFRAFASASAAVVGVRPGYVSTPHATSTRRQRFTCAWPCCVCPASARTFSMSAGSTVATSGAGASSS